MRAARVTLLGFAMVLGLHTFGGTAFASTPVSVSFIYTGSEQTLQLPASVASVDIVAIGGAGGVGQSSGSLAGGAGGHPAKVTADTIAVTPGSVLYVEVGQNGSPFGNGGASPSGATGGDTGMTLDNAGGGGAATEVRNCSAMEVCSGEPRLVVAGGGGGGGAAGNSANPGDVGAGGAGGNAGAGGSGGGTGGHPDLVAAGDGGPGGQSTGGTGGGGGHAVSPGCNISPFASGPGVTPTGRAGGNGGDAAGGGSGDGGGGGGGFFGGGGGGGGGLEGCLGDGGTGGGAGGGGGSSLVAGATLAQLIADTTIDTSGTPSVTISYTLPGPAATVAVALSKPSITADGTSTTTATATVKDAGGLTVPGESVTFTSSDPGQPIGPIIDNHDGTYTAQITASTRAGSSTITATDTATGVHGDATLVETPGPAESVRVTLAPATILADGKSTTGATATVSDANGNNEPSGDSVSFASTDSGEKIGPVTDNGIGTYTATITASIGPGTATITATDLTVKLSGQATLTQRPVASKIAVTLVPMSIPADGASRATATASVTDSAGGPVPGDKVSFASSDSGERIGPVTDHGTGTYSATITASHTVGTATITATDITPSPSVNGHAALIQTQLQQPPPRISDVKFVPSKFKRKHGAKLKLTLSAPSSVTVVVERTIRGRISRGRCDAHAKHGKRCTSYVKKATLDLHAHAGANTFTFRPSRLRPGHYTATVTAFAATGLASNKITVTFTIK